MPLMLLLFLLLLLFLFIVVTVLLVVCVIALVAAAGVFRVSLRVKNMPCNCCEANCISGPWEVLHTIISEPLDNPVVNKVEDTCLQICRKASGGGVLLLVAGLH